ncbi:unnamed protein product, partial [Rotaria sp. Silwood2]
MRTALSIQPKSIYDELYSLFGGQAPTYNTVTRWSKCFCEVQEEIEDQPQPGRPIVETTPGLCG